MGFEPTIPGFAGRCLDPFWATGPVRVVFELGLFAFLSTKVNRLCDVIITSNGGLIIPRKLIRLSLRKTLLLTGVSY